MTISSAAAMPPGEAERIAARLFRLSIGVFFIGGCLSACVSLLVPRLRFLTGLNYAAATSVQLAFHASYLLFALPIAAFISAYGYMRGHAAGLLLMSLGAIAIIAGFASASFVLLLAALLTLSAGTSFLQIASNTAVTVTNDPARAAVRLNILQGFNSIGTVAGPLLGAPFILASRTTPLRIPGLAVPFGGATVVTALLAAAFWHHRDLLRGARGSSNRASANVWAGLWRDARLRGGAAAIFAYVGAEVTIGALLTDYLMLPGVLGVDAIMAARLVSLYWGGAMVGRFAGAWLLYRVGPSRILAAAATIAAGLASIAALGHGLIAAIALIGVGLFNSVMYPTIYVLALPTEPGHATPGATILCMAVVGGAVIPPLTGILADANGLAPALLLPAACYVAILLFAQSCTPPRP
ncbi:MFS transporter [Sphingomonas sp. Ant20]|uniref:MFS transporter n=1 Tax=Sphingomonas sp. Ant20 TaxID=104605 RepID=UPI00053882ED|nr:MFS transporter [Sphingomonas sp. Ant20]KHA63621.1 hypothetical protein NI18_14680 [Sphingomonas sp. Ant20]